MGIARLGAAWNSGFGTPGEEYFTPNKVEWTVPPPEDGFPVPDNSWTEAFQVLDDQQISVTFPDDAILEYDPVLDIELRDVETVSGYTGEQKFTQQVYIVGEAAGGINIQLSSDGQFDTATVIIVDNDHPNFNNALIPPPNDNFASAIVLSGSQITTTGYNTMATSEEGEPDHNGSAGSWGASVWWSWTAPETGSVIIDTVGSTFDTALDVYTGPSVSALLPVTVFEDTFTEQVLFEAVAGTTYRIAVDGEDEYFGSEAEWGLSGYIELDILQEQPNFTIIPQGSGTTVISDFGGVGTGVNPSNEVINQVDTLKLFDTGTELTAANMLLTQQGENLVISFGPFLNTEVVLNNFALENLDNLSIENGASVTIGNILFGEDKTIQDSFDVVDASNNISAVFRANTVTFLNDLDNQTTGLENSNDVINAQAGNDILSGLSGNDTLRGNGGIDTLNGGTSGDYLYGGEGNDYLDGWTENDYLSGEVGYDYLVGYDGDDNLSGGTEDDTLYGQVGNDTLYGDEGNDYLDGWTENDYLSGAAGYDYLVGYDGDDNLSGGTEDDTLYGQVGNDTLNGNEGNDYLSGEAGNDNLGGEDGDDILDGGTGDDGLYGQVGNDALYGSEGNDYLNGWTENDYLYGEAGYDNLVGYDGDDNLSGGTEDDILYGEAGNDILNGFGSGTEYDTIIGGDGADIFVLGDIFATYYQGLGYAVINDFDRTQGDKIQVFGSASDYTLYPFASLNVVDIYYQGERIGAVNNTADIIIANDFIFV